MQEGDFGVFKTSLGINIEGEIIDEMADLIKIRSVTGFIRMINKKEVLQFTPKSNNITDKITL